MVFRSASRYALFAFAVLLGVALFVVALHARRSHSWRAGSIVRGSIEHASSGESRFVIGDMFPVMGVPHTSHLAVWYDGELPSTVCDGVEVYVEGDLESDHFEATSVAGIDTGRPWRCWRFRCSPVALRACEGGHRFH